MNETRREAAPSASPDPAGLGGSSAFDRAPSVPRPPFPWKTRVAVPALVLTAAAVLLAISFRDLLSPGVAVRAVPVVLHASSGPSASVATRAAGWMEPDPYPVLVPALADGIVSEVLVLEGATVEKDQVVARLVPDDAELSLRRSEAAVAEATALRDAAKRDLETLVDLRRAADVAKAARDGAAAAVRSADAKEEEARVDLHLASEELKRDVAQRAADAIPEFTLVRTRLRKDTAAAALADAAAAADSARAMLAEREADLAAAAEALRLRIPETRAAAAAEAALDAAVAMRDEARLRLHRMEVRSPVAGVVLRRVASPGSKMMRAMDDPFSSAPVLLYDPARLQVRVDVPLADAARVGVGSKARITVETLPDRAFDGEVTRVVHEADLQKNTVQFKVRVHDPDPQLKPEMLARVEFLGLVAEAGSTTPAARETVWAPENLLERTGEGRARAWVEEGGRAARRDVTLGGGRRDGWVEVTEGLRAGERVLDGVPADLEPGDRVRIVAAEGGSHAGH